MTNPTCATCRWWDVADDDVPRAVKEESSAMCRRYPPVLNHTVVYLMSQDEDNPDSCQLDDAEDEANRWTAWKFPSTQYDDFCGEHSPRIPLPMSGNDPVQSPLMSLKYGSKSANNACRKFFSDRGMKTVADLIKISWVEFRAGKHIGLESFLDTIGLLQELGVAWPSDGVKGDAK